MDRPIIFSGPMVRAILDGRKSQTRRVLPKVKRFSLEYERDWHVHVLRPGGSMPDEWSWWEGPSHGPSMYWHQRVPFAVGDRRWVREALHRDPDVWKYTADGVEVGWPARRDLAVRPRDYLPSIHMPRIASRLTLTVTEVRVQRLQDISENDAFAEGIQRAPDADDALMTGRECYRHLWDSLNSDRGFGWDTNPWVVAVSFETTRMKGMG